MPVVNPLARELVFKIVYSGPGLGGKTTNLQHVHAVTRPEHRGKLVSLATPVDRTLYFDFLPIRVPTVRGMNVRVQLFTVPGQVHFNATRKLVLTGADGVVLIADSQRARADANLESLENLIENLGEHGHALSDFPHVLAYNKRDLSEITPIEELERRLNRYGAPAFPAVAARGEGVFETLEAIVRAVLGDFDRRMPGPHDGERLELAVPEGGLTEALRGSLGLASAGQSAAEPSARAGSGGAPGAARDIRSQSGTFRFAEPPVPAADALARAVVEPDAAEGAEHGAPSPLAPSFSSLFPAAEAAGVRELEAALARGEHESAVAHAEQLVARALASAAAVLGGSTDAPRDPATVALLIGLDGRRYLEFRALVRDARAGRAIPEEHALAAWSFAVEARIARRRLR
ncbi:MAG: gliding motility protein [Sorangiineae bacterium]|nr:gliding motility protein [Polyangiaceae bacterium]MEB2324272.1 gliding motility protein [Sorangiineae bacterium]